MPIIILVSVGAVLWLVAGRPSLNIRLGPTATLRLAAALCAVSALVTGVRGMWTVSLVFLCISGCLSLAASRRRGTAPTAPAAGMNPDDARAILGVGVDATRADIESAYRRLMLRAHPDHGGSSHLAAQVNAARDCLIKMS